MRNLKSAEGYMTMKLDMSRTYDRVEWGFLDAVMVHLWFDTGWRCRVMECVRSVTIFVSVNGKPSEDFSPYRGIREGDPFSPYLFILCVEVFSNLLRRAEKRNVLKGVRVVPTAPSVNHLLFVDDCITFLELLCRIPRLFSRLLVSMSYLRGKKLILRRRTFHPIKESRKRGIKLLRGSLGCMRWIFMTATWVFKLLWGVLRR